ncbi:unnamed protein product [Haemonchus placei]|uniref:RRM domain-containing protein n=1 Tax=Haemonchus placei TaxID=6290 RepID=A0A0N4WAT2_HAEPC|nr:unnamed protein product [Haemonchus placei]
MSSSQNFRGVREGINQRVVCGPEQKYMKSASLVFLESSLFTILLASLQFLSFFRIYVSNIPFSFRGPDLVQMFSPFGVVSNAEIVMNERGSKGFGFVTLDTKEGCEAARAALNGMVVQGRVIEVWERLVSKYAVLSIKAKLGNYCIIISTPHNLVKSHCTQLAIRIEY